MGPGRAYQFGSHGRNVARTSGQPVVFSGKNREKIDRIVASLDAGIHVFADKPWIIVSKDISKLERALDTAERKGLAAYDIMTERFEITSILQRGAGEYTGCIRTCRSTEVTLIPVCMRKAFIT